VKEGEPRRECVRDVACPHILAPTSSPKMVRADSSKLHSSIEHAFSKSAYALRSVATGRSAEPNLAAASEALVKAQLEGAATTRG
jgi:hypothetical protein